MRFHKTVNQACVPTPVRAQRETENLSPIERGPTSVIVVHLLFLFACLGFYLGMAAWILLEVSSVWGIMQ